MTKNLNWLFLEIFLGGLSEFWKFALQLSLFIMEKKRQPNFNNEEVEVLTKGVEKR